MNNCIYQTSNHTVRLYDASNLPVFLVATVAVPNCVRASNVGIFMLMIFPGLLKKKYCKELADATNRYW